MDNNFAVVGVGRMGKSIIDFLIGKDANVIAITRTEEQSDRLNKKWHKSILSKKKYGVLSLEESENLLGQFHAYSDISKVSNADIIIETVNEDLDVKRNVISQISKYLKDDSIVVSNSSSIFPLELVEGTPANTARFLGLHFFFPVSISNIVEVITHDYLDKDVRERIDKIIEKFALIKLEQNCGNAFLLNMLSMAVGGEAFRGAEKFGFKETNELSKSEIFPLGVFSLFDHVGLSVILEATSRYSDHDPLENRESYKNLLGFMEIMVAESSNERKFSDIKNPCELSGWVNEMPPLSDDQEEFKERLNYLHINTCLIAVEKNLIGGDVIDKAIISIMGSDKGPLQMADEIGRGKIREALDQYYRESNASYYYPSALLEVSNG